MNNMDLRNLLESSGRRMRDALLERLLSHPGESGANREEIVRQFLRAYLPQRFEVSTGFAFDSRGRVSQQLDIVIANSLVCPYFETAGGIRLYPCESIVAVGQIKSRLKTRDEFNSALANLASVKSLDRSANGRAFDKIYKEEIDNTVNHLHQIFTFAFVTGDVLSQDSARDELEEYVLSEPAHIWPNVIYALDKYLITFCCDKGVCPNPMDARGIAVATYEENADLLMRFYLLLGASIEVTRVSGLPHWEYLQHLREWSTEVWYSATDDPPPYLSAISRG